MIKKDYLKSLIIIFFIGCFVGWFYEVIFYYFTENRITNSGALYGPWLPIYGTGAVLITLIKPLKKNPILLFLSMILITGILEYVVGFILLEFRNMRLWDYRGLFLDIGGFVCLRSVLSFAFAGLALVYLIEPFVEKINKKDKRLNIILCILVLIFVADVILSYFFRTPYMYSLIR